MTARSTATTTTSGSRRDVRPLRLRRPDVVVALAAYAMTRVFAWVVISRAATHQQPSVWTGKRSGYLDMASLWDAQWYRLIATQGYPVPLPVDANGVVQQNAWAFFPGFPYTVKAVMALTGLPFSAAAVLTNLVLGALLVVVVLTLLQRVAGRHVGLAGVVLLCAFPSAPTLQIAYSEPLGLLLVALALLWLIERRYGLTACVVILLSLTRPVVAPFAGVVAVHLALRWRARRREAFPAKQRVQVVLLGLLSAASSLLWPGIVGWVTGVGMAYARTQAAWRTGGEVRPFSPAWWIARLLFGEDALLVLVLGSLAFVAVVLSPWGRRVGGELQAWLLLYPTYLLAATEPWTSTFRYLLLMFPLGSVAAGILRSRPRLMWAAVLALAAVGLALQVRWVNELLVFVPPTDYPP
jgi:hypothetical protein